MTHPTFDTEFVRQESEDRQSQYLRKRFLKFLTEDSETKDRRMKEFNQAIFNKEKGYAIFHGTDLDMVMDKFDKALRLK